MSEFVKNINEKNLRKFAQCVRDTINSLDYTWTPDGAYTSPISSITQVDGKITGVGTSSTIMLTNVRADTTSAQLRLTLDDDGVYAYPGSSTDPGLDISTDYRTFDYTLDDNSSVYTGISGGKIGYWTDGGSVSLEINVQDETKSEVIGDYALSIDSDAYTLQHDTKIEFESPTLTLSGQGAGVVISPQGTQYGIVGITASHSINFTNTGTDSKITTINLGPTESIIDTQNHELQLNTTSKSDVMFGKDVYVPGTVYTPNIKLTKNDNTSWEHTIQAAQSGGAIITSGKFTDNDTFYLYNVTFNTNNTYSIGIQQGTSSSKFGLMKNGVASGAFIQEDSAGTSSFSITYPTTINGDTRINGQAYPNTLRVGIESNTAIKKFYIDSSGIIHIE